MIFHGVIMTTLKQFLKPDWRKIMITIILVIFPIYYLLELNPFIEILAILGFLLILPSAFVLLLFYEMGIINTLIFEANIPQLILISSIIYYLLICLIVFIYNKYKKK